MEKTKKILKLSLPYALILAFSVIGTYLVFYEGFGWGSDFEFHFLSMLDKYTTILKTGSLSVISGNLALGLGMGNGLFYSPVSHIAPVFLALALKPLGISLLSAFKITFVLGVFLSGIFMYRFAMHFTNNNKFSSIIASGVYAFYPYRYFCAYCRLALAEAFSFVFIPLFLMGLYDITHMDKKKIKLIPFCEVILGGALLYLTHNITAMLVFICGIVYLIANIKKLLPLIKRKKYLLCGSVSVILLIGMTSIMLFSQLELMKTGMYNLTDEVRMWTNSEEVASRAGEQLTFSGFLNLGFLKGKGISAGRVLLEILFYILGCVAFVISNFLLKRVKVLKDYAPYICSILLFGIPTIILPRLEIYLGLMAFFLVYLFSCYAKEAEKPKKPIYKDVLFWFSIGVIAAAFVLMDCGQIWLYMPSLIRNIQFPWRMWSLVQTSVSVLIGVIASHFGRKRVVKYGLVLLIGLLVVTNQGLIEKRIAYNEGKRWVDGISEEMYQTHSSIGFNSEYCPQVFFNKEYKSQYDNSLYYQIKRVLPYNFDYEKYYYYQPVFLTGSGEIKVNYAYAPEYEMEIKVKEAGIVQMPLIYYPGYKITLENSETGEKIKLKGENIDGLVAFSMPSGSYTVTTKYAGTPLRQFSIWFSVISSLTVIVAIGYEIVKKRRESQCR